VVVANLLARAYDRAGRRRDALEALDRVLASSPRDVATLTNLAGLWARGGEFAEAARLLERARRSDPSNPAVIASLIVALGDSRDLAAARRVLAEAGPVAERVENAQRVRLRLLRERAHGRGEASGDAQPLALSPDSATRAGSAREDRSRRSPRRAGIFSRGAGPIMRERCARKSGRSSHGGDVIGSLTGRLIEKEPARS